MRKWSATTPLESMQRGTDTWHPTVANSRSSHMPTRMFLMHLDGRRAPSGPAPSRRTMPYRDGTVNCCGSVAHIWPDVWRPLAARLVAHSPCRMGWPATQSMPYGLASHPFALGQT